MHPVDRLLRTAARTLVKAPGISHRLLTPLRTSALSRAIATARPRGQQLAARLASGDATARGELADAAEAALAQMRAEVRDAARASGVLARVAAEGDARWGDNHTVELMDDPDLDEVVRQSIVADLDVLNGALGSYSRFLDELAPMMATGRPTRVLDLAAGHGGFALAAARAASERGLELHFTASDLKREYLDLGADIARREGLSVDFIVQDALNLSNLDEAAYDIITCTQALHHFPPGLVAVMFEAAARAAGRGVVFIDGCRSALTGVGLAAFGLLRFGSANFVHDAWVSSRRFFVPEELELLARVGPWGDRVEARWVRPGFCVVRLESA